VKALLRMGETELTVDLSRPISLALDMEFSGREPRHFGAPAPITQPFAVPGFSGSVATGASCNCSTITLTPHCNGTHTECVGHLTVEKSDAHRVLPAGLLPAVVLSVRAVSAGSTSETTTPAPHAEDFLITRAALETAWASVGLFPANPQAVVIRTRYPATAQEPSPYLTRAAVEWLVARGLEHLVIDLPSIDRAHDEGRLTAHRIFFGLPPRSRALGEATRRHSTITELACIPDRVPDGFCLLELQAPAIGGDAVPSRPLIYLPLTA